MKAPSIFAKIGYGALFSVLVPLGLWLWNSRLNCPFPTVQSTWIGATLLATGIFLMLLAMWRLWSEGGGLPMNAFPPPRLVMRGVYSIIPHPIYCGFVLVCAGIAFVSGSASGLWIVTPLAGAGCLAIVLGYESPNLQARFGSQLPEPWLGVPKAGKEFVALNRRLGTMLAVLVPFAISYLAVKVIGVSPQAVESRRPSEWQIPILPSTMPIYASIYLVVPLMFLVLRRRSDLRRLALATLVATGLNTFVYLTIPLTAAFRPGETMDWLGKWLAWEQQVAQPPAGSFPAFHATWAVICAAFFSRIMLARRSSDGAGDGTRSNGKRLLPLALPWSWCIALCYSCLTTGMHSRVDILAGAATGGLAYFAPEIWRYLVRITEKLGNHWNSWQIGPLRVMNHSLWSGLAGFCLCLMAGMSTLPSHLGWVMFVAVLSLLGAGLWAQWVEGSSALLRPFGYYGALLGGLLAFLLAALLRGPVTELMAAFALAAPWTQAVGRFRCIVQGCCHGRAVPWGIRITNPHSRVVKLAGFNGNPIHPTPLYSILSCGVIGVLLLRIRLGGADAFQISGLYLILAGLTRFVEEAYRGEPQTARFAGLPLYQWMAIGSLLLGMALMSFHGSGLSEPHPPSPPLLVTSVSWGLVCAFAMSMDFPNSNRRFSRLTG